MTDIVERLRICAKYDPDQAEAADEIERLRDEEDHLHKMTIKWSVLQAEGSLENQKLKKQNAELVEVLKEIANADMFDDECKPTGGGYLINKARAAIAKATGGE